MPVYGAEQTGWIRNLLNRKTVGEVELFEELALEVGAERILELACGYGRIMMPLAEKGFTIVGVEASKLMIDDGRARTRKLNRKVRKRVLFVHGDMRDFLFEIKFKLIIIPYDSFWHNLNEEDAEQCLDCILRHLLDDGVFVIDAPRLDFEWWNDIPRKKGIVLQKRDYTCRRLWAFDGTSGYENRCVAIGRKI